LLDAPRVTPTAASAIWMAGMPSRGTQLANTAPPLETVAPGAAGVAGPNPKPPPCRMPIFSSMVICPASSSARLSGDSVASDQGPVTAGVAPRPPRPPRPPCPGTPGVPPGPCTGGVWPPGACAETGRAAKMKPIATARDDGHRYFIRLLLGEK